MPNSDIKSRNYVRSTTGVWTPVGFGATDAVMPVALANSKSPGSVVMVSAYGQLMTSTDPTVAFTDSFEGTVFDTVNRWNAYGTVAPTQAAGNVSVNPAATANATCAIASQAIISTSTPVTIAGLISFETGTTALGTHRFWGFGSVTGNVGTAAAPLTDAVGFEVDVSGVLRASVYRAGARVFTAVLTMPTDGLPHIFMMNVRGDMTMFYVDDTQVPIAMTFVGSASQLLPMRAHSLNSASVTGTPVLVAQGLAVMDSFRQTTGLADGTYTWRKARIDPQGALSVAPRAADLAVTATGAAGAAVTLTLPAAGAGQFHYISGVQITKYATAAITGAATPVLVTTTNLPGTIAYTFETAQAVGTSIYRQNDFGLPVKSSVANTATTIVCPIVTSVLWRVTVTYYTAL